MYLVELRPGKEELYRTSDELAAAIRTGEVDVHSRIYHRATSKWISITLHPQYKAITTDPKPSGAPLPPPSRSQWTFFNSAAESLEGAAPEAEPPVVAEGGDSDSGATFRRPLALSLTGLLLILGIQLAFSGPRPPWSKQAVKHTEPPVAPDRQASFPADRPASQIVSLASTATAWPGEDVFGRFSSEATPDAGAPDDSSAAIELPSAPRIRMKASPIPRAVTLDAAQRSPRTGSALERLLDGWATAHDSADARLETGFRIARLNQLFAAPRLSPGGGVTETRMSLAGVANVIRVYRQQQVVIEETYQDSFAVESKRPRISSRAIREWYSKPTRKEDPKLQALSTSLLQQVDSLLGLLDAQAGAYSVTNGMIRFEDSGASRAYAALRVRITTTVVAARTAGAAGTTGPAGALLRSIGSSELPQEI
jgi:hypothetical protein